MEGKIRLKSMLICVMLILGFIDAKEIVAQNRYDNPADATFSNTYVPIDWELLIKIGKANQRMKEQETILKWLKAYESFSYYPQSISDGWHSVWIIDTRNITLVEAEMCVAGNSVYYVRARAGEKTYDVDGIPIKKGYCQIPGQIAFFYKEIISLNR